MKATSTHIRAKNIDDLRIYCKPRPLAENELDAYYVETDAARDPHQHTRERLAKSLEHEPSRVLFYGHPGSGKSTELNKFLSVYKEQWLPVKFSVLDEMTPVNTLAEDLILVITAQTMRAARDNDIHADEHLLKDVFDYFGRVTRARTTSRRGALTTEGGTNVGDSILGKLVGLMAGITAEIKVESHSDETSAYILRKRPHDLLDQANRVIAAVQQGLKDKGKRLLVVIEDIDKLDLKQAREMFVNNANLLTGLTTDIIYTIPIYLFHSSDLDSFKHKFDYVIPLPMIKVHDPKDGQGPGYDIVETIVKERVEDGVIHDDALRLLIEKTGGVLRHLFEVLNTVSTMTNVTLPISKEAMRYGLDQLRKTCAQQIALPIDNTSGINSVTALYDRLEDFAKRQRQGEKPPFVSDAINQLLLKSCALIEYNGEGWVGVHPLVIEQLEKLGRLTSHEP